jgi:hypothetical protein
MSKACPGGAPGDALTGLSRGRGELGDGGRPDDEDFAWHGDAGTDREAFDEITASALAKI